MATMANELINQIHAMPDGEKLKLVDLILTQLDKPDPEIDRVWAEEARKRWMAYKEGKVSAVPYAQVMEKYHRQ